MLYKHYPYFFNNDFLNGLITISLNIDQNFQKI